LQLFIATHSQKLALFGKSKEEEDRTYPARGESSHPGRLLALVSRVPEHGLLGGIASWKV